MQNSQTLNLLVCFFICFHFFEDFCSVDVLQDFFPIQHPNNFLQYTNIEKLFTNYKKFKKIHKNLPTGARSSARSLLPRSQNRRGQTRLVTGQQANNAVMGRPVRSFECHFGQDLDGFVGSNSNNSDEGRDNSVAANGNNGIIHTQPMASVNSNILNNQNTNSQTRSQQQALAPQIMTVQGRPRVAANEILTQSERDNRVAQMVEMGFEVEDVFFAVFFVAPE